MQILDWVFIISCIIICIASSVSDLKKRKIPNAILFPTFGILFPLSLIYHLSFGMGSIYLRNFLFAAVFSVLLYAGHFFSAGDSKLLIVLAAGMPTILYQETIAGWFPIITWLIFLFSVAFLYLVGESVWYTIRRKSRFSRRIPLREMLKEYAQKLVLVTLLNECIWLSLPMFYNENQYIVLLLDFFVLIFLSEHMLHFRTSVIVATGVITIAIGFACNYLGRIQLSSLLYLPIILLFWVLQYFLSAYNYYTIETLAVEKDMILSTESSLLMQASIVKGLPDISTEDMRSKLTESEVLSIHRWAKSKNGQAEIIIVRTLPFGSLIALGTVCYLLMRGVLIWRG